MAYAKFPQLVASTAKAIGIPTEEAMEFAKNIVNELLAGEEPNSAKNN